MTRPDALRTILRAQNYLTYLSLEDAGTGHESRLADELGEALKVLSEPEPRKWTWNCGVCGLKISGDIAGCPNCLPKIDPADTPTRVIPAAEMIRREPFDAAQGIIDDLAARTAEVVPLVWEDDLGESNTACGRYQVDHGVNGWHAYHFDARDDSLPMVESDAPFETVKQAKAWCQGHADAEALEPRRCERCKMPVEANHPGPDCLDCLQRLVDMSEDGALLNGQAVKVAASDFTF